ncbi:MAG: hypothetical protein QNK37_22985 [Acidobacteriota bacterium]|nr:hypothetical protein [Acidobacteriota bacterium]
MTTILFLLLTAQQTTTTTFIPITPGNTVPIDSFQLIVPDGVKMADEDNVTTLYPLIGVSAIPNCAGIIFDGDNDWDYQIIIQHFPFQRFQLDEELDEEILTTLYSQNHFLTKEPYVGDYEFFMPPFLNRNERSFSVGVQYFNTENKAGFFAKKIYISDQGGLVLSLNAKEDAYYRNEEKIQSVFQSVSLNPNAEKIALEMEPLSYLELLGVSKQVNPQTMVAGSESSGGGLPASVIMTSIILAGVAGFLLFFAVRLQKKSA